jgi:hypothetical protein
MDGAHRGVQPVGELGRRDATTELEEQEQGDKATRAHTRIIDD